ncbi:MAG: twin-arginine translocase TatA/TatE family subunit [Leptonema sp. (in: Bacteria)]|nr:twin-arginine translocase TatA/TatE family subunit [Leptonema sp. (in: bacteria)]
MFPTIMLIGGLGTTEMFFILLIALLLFGGRKIPELARDLGTGIRDFRRSLNAPPEDDKKNNDDEEELKQIEYHPAETVAKKRKSSTTAKATRKTTRKA